jgi:hypothetical protein
MTHVARLLGNDQRHLNEAIAALHVTLDGASHDVQLLGDLAQKSAQLKKTLGLDPRDTTPHELYVSLRKTVGDDNLRLAGALGIQHANAVSEATPLIIRALRRQHKDTYCFAVKSTRLKSLLKDNPPKKVMHALHYRSLDSMLKHEPASQLVLLARYIEDEVWQQKHNALLADMTVNDFEVRPIEIVWLDKAVLAEALAGSIKKHHLVLHAKEAGSVAVGATLEKVINAYTIRTFSLMQHYIQEVLYASSFAKTVMTHTQFGEQYSRFITDTRRSNLQIASYSLPWRVLHKAVNKTQLIDVFPPHMSQDDWDVHHPNDKLNEHNEHITLWAKNGYVITGQDEHVGANVIDLAIDESYDKPFGQHSLKYARRDLEQELFQRYFQEPRVHNVILKRLRII